MNFWLNCYAHLQSRYYDMSLSTKLARLGHAAFSFMSNIRDRVSYIYPTVNAAGAVLLLSETFTAESMNLSEACKFCDINWQEKALYNFDWYFYWKVLVSEFSCLIEVPADWLLIGWEDNFIAPRTKGIPTERINFKEAEGGCSRKSKECRCRERTKEKQKQCNLQRNSALEF